MEMLVVAMGLGVAAAWALIVTIVAVKPWVTWRKG